MADEIGSGATLRGVLTPLISYATFFARTPAYQQQTFAEVRAAIQRQLEKQRELVRRHDISPTDHTEACFAVIAWIDELVLGCTAASNRQLYDQWRRSPLQVEHYGTANAGEEFFDHLERLGPRQNDVREIYHLCLCLGFRGRFYDETQEHRLAELRRQTGHRLPVPVVDLLELEKRGERITPEPYAVRPPAPRKPRRPVSPLLVGVTLAGLVAAVLFFLWPKAESPRPDRLETLRERLAAFECCEIEVAGFDEATGAVRLTGRVESEAQREQVRAAAKEVPDIGAVQEDFRVVPRPFCEVIEVLAPFHERSRTAGMGLDVEPQNGCDTVYHENDSLAVDVSAKKVLRHVHVDYYVADRSAVAHLLPNPREPDHLFDDRTRVTVGGPDSAMQWQVQPPFGLELVTVISSPIDLFLEPRQASEDVQGYLTALRHALGNEDSSTGVTAAYCFITTEK